MDHHLVLVWLATEQSKLWVTILLAVCVKILLSPWQSLGRAAGTATAGIFAATVGAEPLLAVLQHGTGWDGSRYVIQMSALLALTGEGVVRYLIELSERPETLVGKLVALWAGFRGRTPPK